MKESLVDQLLIAKEKVIKAGQLSPYAILMPQKSFNTLMAECDKRSLILPKDPIKLHGLVVEVNPFMPEDQILIIPIDMYHQMKQNQLSMN